MKPEYAEYLLKKTKNDYNLIAEEWSRVKAFVPEDIKPLGEYTLAGERVLDLGCGNGRLLEMFKEKRIDYIGVDISEKLIEIAKKKYPPQPRPPEHKDKKEVFLPIVRFQVASALNLPFPNNYFHKIYSIAVFHHIPSEEFRLQFLKEARRVLIPEGLLILTVWNLWQRLQPTHHPNIIKLFFKYTLLKLIGQSRLDFKDIFYPWKSANGKILIQRYFHLFTKNELENLSKKSGFKIKEIGISKSLKTKESNIYLIAQK